MTRPFYKNDYYGATHPKWRRIAHETKNRVNDIISCVEIAKTIAARSLNRGVLEASDVNKITYYTNMSIKKTQKIFDALVEEGFLDFDAEEELYYITNWNKYQDNITNYQNHPSNLDVIFNETPEERTKRLKRESIAFKRQYGISRREYEKDGSRQCRDQENLVVARACEGDVENVDICRKPVENVDICRKPVENCVEKKVYKNSTFGGDIGGEKKEERKEKEERKKIYKKKKTTFEKPSVDEVRDFCEQNNFSINPEAFWNYNESRGWLVGKSAMKCWKSAVRTWVTNQKEYQKTNQNNNIKPNLSSQYGTEATNKFITKPTPYFGFYTESQPKGTNATEPSLDFERGSLLSVIS